jgi:hypothetical protein
MLSEMKAQGELCQDEAVYQIAQMFGGEFTYHNEAGNPAISKTVLAAFNQLTGNDVVWSRSERLWRPRVPADLLGRMQP